MINCTICQKEVEIKTPGSYVDVLDCGHILSKPSQTRVIGSGANAVEASEITQKLTKVTELPKINGNDLVARALSTVNQTYEDFFNSENPIIEEMIAEHGKDNAVLIFTAIHAHLNKVLFATNRFRNLYYVKIEQLRKEVEDRAVKELISNHEFNPDFDKLTPKPKKIKTLDKRHSTEIDKARTAIGGLTDKDGKPLDVTKMLSNLMWKKDEKKDKEKTDYKEGLNKIKESILNKDDKKEEN